MWYLRHASKVPIGRAFSSSILILLRRGKAMSIVRAVTSQAQFKSENMLFKLIASCMMQKRPSFTSHATHHRCCNNVASGARGISPCGCLDSLITTPPIHFCFLPCCWKPFIVVLPSSIFRIFHIYWVGRIEEGTEDSEEASVKLGLGVRLEAALAAVITGKSPPRWAGRGSEAATTEGIPTVIGIGISRRWGRSTETTKKILLWR